MTSPGDMPAVSWLVFRLWGLYRPCTVNCTWGHSICPKSGRIGAMCHQEYIPGRMSMQGRQGPDLWQDIGEHATSSAHASTTPTPTAVHSRATYLEVAHPGTAGPARAHRRLPESPGISPLPPAVTSVLGKPSRKTTTTSRTGCDRPPFYLPPQKTQSPNPALP